MKNKTLLSVLLPMLLLASCNSTADTSSSSDSASSVVEETTSSADVDAGATETNSSSTVSETPSTENAFQAQLAAAGITTVTYEDINAPISEAEVKPENEADIDLVTGASGGAGTDYYAVGGSYYTLDQMVKRANMQYYYSVTWVAATDKDTVKATTLQEAAALADAKYVSDAFPNDGTAYVIKKSGNAIATKTVVTKSKDGALSTAIFGLGAKKTGEEYFITGAITKKTTLQNLLYTGTAEILIYEYNPTTADKSGAGARNYGCRLEVSVDTANSYFIGATYAPLAGEAKNFVIGSESYPEGAAGAMISLKVTKMYTLG